MSVMKKLFNDNWHFAELAINDKDMYQDGNPVFLTPESFYPEYESQQYKPVRLPHDWMIWHVKELYKNSAGFYKKQFTLSKEEVTNRHNAIRFEGVYMNSAVWVNGTLAGQWKYGYGTFEFDISHLVKEGENQILVIAVYQNCNTRWYSGAGIFRDVTYINTPETFLASHGSYVICRPDSCNHNFENDIFAKESGLWKVDVETEVACKNEIQDCFVKSTLKDKNGKVIFQGTNVKPEFISKDETENLAKNVPVLEKCKILKSRENFSVENPDLWDIDSPTLYTLTTELINNEGQILDSNSQNLGFRVAVFDKNKGLILNGRHIKIYGSCHHHDQGALGAAFDVDALRRQFNILKEMGVNSVRCSHNPPPEAWMNLADEMGILVDDEAFDMWEKPKTPFDYGNYFNEWCKKDTLSWVRKDRNHPSLLMWSIGNEIYDTHMGNGFEITKKLSSFVREFDPEGNAPITIASNYMMSDGAQKCATEIDTVGYNYLERLYNEHHEKYPEWKIYGSETSSTVQSRGIYHFPETLKLITFSDLQCSSLGNCTTTWGAENTQTVIAADRDCPFSAGQYIWTGWDYIGEPTPYHTKNSYFGQIDTAGFPKDTYYLYKSEWDLNGKPFVHILPYWDWNKGQLIDVKAYSNASSLELFFNGKTLGKQELNHINGKEPFGRWQLTYEPGELKVIAYDKNGKEIASETKNSFGDPENIILKGETEKTGNLYFVDVMLSDKNGTLVENARNYVTISVAGNAELVGIDNGDSTDYEEYVSENKTSHTRKLFGNRMVAIIRGKVEKPVFVVTAASTDLPNTSIKYDGQNWIEAAPYNAVHAVEDFIPARKIEIIAEGSTLMNAKNREIKVTAKVLPENASIKEINWNPVLKECVSSDYIEVCNIQGKGTGVETAVIKANCDGECILRCTAKNGTNQDEVISDLGFTVEGIGNPKLNPYKLIEACRLNSWDESKSKPTVSLESGIQNRGLGATWVSFDKVDFGNEGADSIHIPIFSFDTELPVEVWDGKPGNGTTYEKTPDSTTGGECLGRFTYKHPSIYNTYSENVFTLSKRLFGVHTISIVIPTELVLHGFYFDKTPKALSKLRALDAKEIVGDTFTKTSEAVEGIGNNVNLDFDHMDFGETKATKLTICGKSNTENNSINVKFFGSNGINKTQVIEFVHTDDYEEKTFEIEPVSGEQKVSFVFLPGCNFDFKWFKFQ